MRFVGFDEGKQAWAPVGLPSVGCATHEIRRTFYNHSYGDGATYYSYKVNEWSGADPPMATLCCPHTALDPHECGVQKRVHPELYLHPSGTFMGDVWEKQGNPKRYGYKHDNFCCAAEWYCLLPHLLIAGVMDLSVPETKTKPAYTPKFRIETPVTAKADASI